METIIIGQGYNLKEETSVGKELIDLFKSHRYNSFTCLVAFASLGGVSALSKEIKEAKERNCEIKVILGVDQKGTSKEALEEVISWGVNAKIYHTKEFNIFHPKVYLFENEDIFSLIVGSNNLTVPGLVQNVECSLMIKDIKSNPVLSKFYDYWKKILDGTEVNLYELTQDLVENLYEDNVITMEAQRSKRYDNGNEEESSTTDKPKNIVFRNAGIQKLPEGFVPKRTQRQVKVKVDGVKVNRKKPVEELHPIGEQVLIAEIGGGTRWKQVNFPISIFQDFFGAHRNDNTYTIDLMNISKDGSLGEVETRQAVTVKSNNFRFEIKCAETMGEYPSNEKRPIGLFLRLDTSEFLYQVLMPGYPAYETIRRYLYMESEKGRKGQLKRVIRNVEAIHALYPELII